MSGHLFADETKQNGYLMVVSAILPCDLNQSRRTVRDLVLPGQRRLHMKNESDSRKKLILSTLGRMAVEAVVYDAGKRYRTQREARAACLQTIVKDAALRGHTGLTLEIDQTLEQWDKQNLIEATRAAGYTMHYGHETASAESLLAIPDALAWAYAKGGDWRRRAGITQIRTV